MSKTRTDDVLGAYAAPMYKSEIVNDCNLTGITDSAGYHMETRTQRLARLGVVLAQKVARMNDDMPYPQAAVLADDIERTKSEILQLSESWEPSNE